MQKRADPVGILGKLSKKKLHFRQGEDREERIGRESTPSVLSPKEKNRRHETRILFLWAQE